MDFIQIGHGVILVGEVTNRFERTDITVHRVHRLERDKLGCIQRRGAQQLFEVFHIVVPPDVLLATGLTDTLDHRGVVQRVGINDQTRQYLAQRCQRRLIGDIARREKQRGFFLVEIGQRALELHMVVRGAGDVARATRAGADIVNRLLHGAGDTGALPHTQIIVRAPHRHVAHAAISGAETRLREFALLAQQISKDAVAAFGTDTGYGSFERCCVIHVVSS